MDEELIIESLKEEKNIILIVLAFFAIYVIWGSTYLLNKIAVAEIPPFFLAGIRFITAGVLIFSIAKLSGKSIAITKKQFWNATFVGFLFLSFGNGVVVWALRFVDSNFAALEISAQPLVILLMMWILQGKKIQPMSLIHPNTILQQNLKPLASPNSPTCRALNITRLAHLLQLLTGSAMQDFLTLILTSVAQLKEKYIFFHTNIKLRTKPNPCCANCIFSWRGIDPLYTTLDAKSVEYRPVE